MQKAIAIIKDEHPLYPFFEKHKQLRDEKLEQIEFLKKRAEKIVESYKPKTQELWRQIEEVCESNGWFPDDYSEEKYSLSYDDESRVLFLEDKNHENKLKLSLLDLLKGLGDPTK